MLHRISALALLSECTGQELWSVDYCRQRGIPEPWIEELRDAFESNLARDSQTIYVDRRRVNQYEGIRDVDLACKLGEYLGVDVSRIVAWTINRQQTVQAIRQAVEEG